LKGQFHGSGVNLLFMDVSTESIFSELIPPDFLVNQYFGIDPDEFWNSAEQDLPRLQKEISLVLNHGSSDSPATSP